VYPLFRTSWQKVGRPCNTRCPPPLQTGHADFPHPAFLWNSSKGTRRLSVMTLLLRLLIKLLSQVSEFRRQPDLLDTGTLPHIIRFPECQLFRNGMFIQAAHFLSYSASPQQGPLAPPCFQGFLATMGLSDSHLRQTSRLFIPGRPSALPRATMGLPGSSAYLSARAFPSHPGVPYRCICPLLPCKFQASPYLAGWPHPI